MSIRLELELSDRQLAVLAELVAELLTERQGEDGDWLRGAEAIADHIGAKRDRVYALSSAGRIPVERDGSALVAKRSELDAWLRNGGATRP
jgi:hypothetical protein